MGFRSAVLEEGRSLPFRADECLPTARRRAPCSVAGRAVGTHDGSRSSNVVEANGRSRASHGHGRSNAHRGHKVTQHGKVRVVERTGIQVSQLLLSAVPGPPHSTARWVPNCTAHQPQLPVGALLRQRFSVFTWLYVVQVRDGRVVPDVRDGKEVAGPDAGSRAP